MATPEVKAVLLELGVPRTAPSNRKGCDEADATLKKAILWLNGVALTRLQIRNHITINACRHPLVTIHAAGPI